MSSLAPNLKLRSRTFFTKLLEEKFSERQLQPKEAFFDCSDAATTIDAWTARRRSYLGQTIHRYDKKILKRKSACLAARRIIGHHTYNVSAKLIESIHGEYHVKDMKIYNSSKTKRKRTCCTSISGNIK